MPLGILYYPGVPVKPRLWVDRSPPRGYNEARTVFEILEDEIEIPIYDLPIHLRAEDLES